MRIRPLLILTGIFSAILGAIVVYLVLSVPNDLRADSLLRDAKKEIDAKKHDAARQKLVSIVQQYPRTDAAAAATAALMTLADSERQKLEHDIATLQSQHAQQAKLIADLQEGVTEVKNKPPQIVTVTAPAPKPAPPKKAPPKKKTSTKRRRR